MSEAKLVIARATAETQGPHYDVAIQAGHHPMASDEPTVLGGGGRAPAPFELLLGALGACTANTLRMYAERKTWPLEKVQVELRYVKDTEGSYVERTVGLEGALTDEARARLADVAERTPVTLALKSGLAIRTSFR